MKDENVETLHKMVNKAATLIQTGANTLTGRDVSVIISVAWEEGDGKESLISTQNGELATVTSALLKSLEQPLQQFPDEIVNKIPNRLARKVKEKRPDRGNGQSA